MSTSMDRESKQRELDELRAKVEQLETELGQDGEADDWQQRQYPAYYATTGFLLGMVAAAVSLTFNIVGSLLWSQWSAEPQHPLRLIQVYLTFPLGEAARHINEGLTLAIGCCLYLGTGMAYGMLFQLALARWTQHSSFLSRAVLVTVLSLAVWLVNFYGILSWLQPLLFQGNWIVELVPWWVAALTHLVFGWTMLLIYPLGLYVPYRVEEN